MIQKREMVIEALGDQKVTRRLSVFQKNDEKHALRVPHRSQVRSDILRASSKLSSLCFAPSLYLRANKIAENPVKTRLSTMYQSSAEEGT